MLVAEARPWLRVDEEGDWVWVWIVGNGQRGMMISGSRRRPVQDKTAPLVWMSSVVAGTESPSFVIGSTKRQTSPYLVYRFPGVQDLPNEHLILTLSIFASNSPVTDDHTTPLHSPSNGSPCSPLRTSNILPYPLDLIYDLTTITRMK
jgi:hypothetical protein